MKNKGATTESRPYEVLEIFENYHELLEIKALVDDVYLLLSKWFYTAF